MGRAACICMRGRGRAAGWGRGGPGAPQALKAAEGVACQRPGLACASQGAQAAGARGLGVSAGRWGPAHTSALSRRGGRRRRKEASLPPPGLPPGVRNRGWGAPRLPCGPLPSVRHRRAPRSPRGDAASCCDQGSAPTRGGAALGPQPCPAPAARPPPPPGISPAPLRSCRLHAGCRGRCAPPTPLPSPLRGAPVMQPVNKCSRVQTAQRGAGFGSPGHALRKCSGHIPCFPPLAPKLSLKATPREASPCYPGHQASTNSAVTSLPSRWVTSRLRHRVNTKGTLPLLH